MTLEQAIEILESYHRSWAGVDGDKESQSAEALRLVLARAKEPRVYALGEDERECWFVESRPNGQFSGWYTAPRQGHGGWETTDPLEAHRYTQAEAVAVANVLNYFRVPFRWAHWEATSHIFVGNEEEPPPCPNCQGTRTVTWRHDDGDTLTGRCPECAEEK